MPEVKWIKITTGMFEDEKIDFIESLPEADSILIIWIKLLAQAGKCNSGGFIFLTENIPYTEEMLAHKFRKPLNVIKMALSTFRNLNMVESDQNGFIKVVNWDKHQNIDGLDKIREKNRLRQAKHRETKKLMLPNSNNDVTSNVTDNVTITGSNAIELDIDKELDIEEEVEVEGGTTSPTLTKENIKTILDSWNKLGLQQLKAINPNTNRHKMLKARLNEYSLEELLKTIDSIDNSGFLKGQNKSNWVITFDWFIKPNNFLKVLEGNYIDKISDLKPAQKPQAEGNKFKTKFHLSKSRGDKYTADELESLILNRQKHMRTNKPDTDGG